MASLPCIPLTAGFFGKCFVFPLAIEPKESLLVIIAIVAVGFAPRLIIALIG